MYDMKKLALLERLSQYTSKAFAAFLPKSLIVALLGLIGCALSSGLAPSELSSGVAQSDLSSGVAQGEGVEALKGLSSVKAVIGFSTSDPRKAVTYLTLIGDTLKDPNIQAVTKTPEFVVSFGGTSVKLFAKETKGFSPEEQRMIEEMKVKIAALAKEGVAFQYCRYAAKLFGVEPATVPGVRVIDNGWVSLIGYQARGYSFVPAD